MLKLQLNYNNLPEKQHKYFDKIIKNEIKRIDKYIDNNPSALLKINVEQTKTTLFKIKTILFFNSTTITTTEEDNSLRTIVEKIFDVIKQNLVKELDKQKNNNKKKIYYEEVPQEIFDLILTKTTKSVSFSDEIKNLIPFLNTYINKLFQSTKNLNIDISQIEPIEILQKTVEYALENFANLPSKLTYKQWLAKIANQKLRNEIRAVYKNNKNLSWESLLEREIDKIEEEITIDADGDFQLATGKDNANLSDEKEESDAKLPDELIIE